MTSERKIRPDEPEAGAEPTGAAQEAHAAGDVFPDFAISLEEANRRSRMLQEFVREQMVEGEDYGVIPGVANKPTLFKPGAEKLNAIFGLAPLAELTNRVEDWDAGFLSYEVKVTLINKRTGRVEAEGVGLCNSRERKYKNQDAANVANTILKMSKKRALIDATLSATRASGMFSQDIDDPELEKSEGSERTPGFTARPAKSSGGFGPPSEPGGSHASSTTRAADGHTRNLSAGTLTEAQRGAILAMGGRVFGRSLHEELARLSDKPLAQLTKGEASGIIDRLRDMLPEGPNGTRENRVRTESENAVAMPSRHKALPNTVAG